MARYPDSQIAAGWNNAGGLVAWENITPTGGTAFYPPIVYGNYNPGVIRGRMDGLAFLAGKPNVLIEWRGNPGGKLTRIQWYYLYNTINGGAYRGKVTVRMRIHDSTSYANYNAILALTKLSETQKNFSIFPRYEAYYLQVTAI